MFTVRLSARENPAMRRGDLPHPSVVHVKTLHEASDACSHFIEEHDLGCGNWSGGQVREVAGGKMVALVSYNGRSWTPERDWRERTEIVTEPEAFGAVWEALWPAERSRFLGLLVERIDHDGGEAQVAVRLRIDGLGALTGGVS